MSNDNRSWRYRFIKPRNRDSLLSTRHLPYQKLRHKLYLTLILCLIPHLAFALDDPHKTWNELESEHFIIHFSSDREEFARRAISIAEEAHARLIPLLNWQPSVKTHLSVTDLSDDANGFVRTVPRNEIRLQAYPPAVSEELGFYDDWLRQLIYHEYTHILHTDTSSGLHPVLNAIFGKFARNNATTPRWYAEGLAVYYESQMSNAGRLRNSLYKTMLFNAAKDRAIPDFGAFNADILHWPRGAAHYLFGSFFLAYISKHYGQESLTRWNHEYGDDWIPYAMNRAALKIWHKTWDELYDEWRANTYDEAQKKLETFGKQTPHHSLISPWRHTRPEIHRERLIYVKNDGYHPKTLVMKSLESGNETALAECWGRCEHHLDQTGETLYFTHKLVKDGYEQHETLFAYDFSTKKVKNLNLHGRIRSFSLDGTNLYRVIQTNESNEIWRYSLETENDECIYQSKPFEQIEDIAVHDGNIAASVFSLKDQSFDINILKNGEFYPLTNDKSPENSLLWLKDGRLGYISDASGELNLWAVDPTTHTRARLTHLFDGILHPAESENGDIYYTQYTSTGTTIATIAASELQETVQTNSAEGESALSIHYPVLSENSHPMRPYKPWHWLWPQTWQPRLSWTEQNKASVGLAFSGSDFLDHHAFSFYLDFLSGKNAFDFQLAYAWTSLLWDLGFDAGLEQSTAAYRDDLKVKNYDYQIFYGDITAKRVLNSRTGSQSIQLSAHAEYSEAHDPLSWSKRNPSARPVYLPTLGWHNALIALYSWGNLHYAERAVSTNDGYSVQALLRFEAPWLGAQAYSIQARLTAAAAWIMPWLESHQLNLKLMGSFSWSENANQPFSLSSAQGVSFNAGDVQLHGYPAGLVFGRHLLYGHAAYTAPLWDIESGHSTLPIGISRLSASIFGDWGYAWTDAFDITHSKFALGANLYLDLQLGYRLPVRLTLGYAWGGAPYGGHEVYLLWAY